MARGLDDCSSCGALILWTKTAAKGKPMPLDASTGRWMIEGEGPDQGVHPPTGAVLKGTAITLNLHNSHAWPGYEHTHEGVRHVRVYTSHFATCPNAGRHRRNA